jgi:hypothetical protein
MAVGRCLRSKRNVVAPVRELLKRYVKSCSSALQALKLALIVRLKGKSNSTFLLN